MELRKKDVVKGDKHYTDYYLVYKDRNKDVKKVRVRPVFVRDYWRFEEQAKELDSEMQHLLCKVSVCG